MRRQVGRGDVTFPPSWRTTAVTVTRSDGADLLSSILAAVAAAGHDVDTLSADVLAPLDHLHTFGLPATLRLAAAAGIAADDVVLDVGCGIGGPARTLATQFGCQLVGVDVQLPSARSPPSSTDAAGSTTSSRSARGRHGAAVRGRRVHRRLDAARLDEHRAKATAVRRTATGPGHRRPIGVLRRARRSAAARRAPRAVGRRDTPERDGNREETRQLVSEAGFTIRQWEDVTESVADHVAGLAGTTDRIDGLGVHIVVPDMAEQTEVLARNVAEGRVTFVQCIADAL